MPPNLKIVVVDGGGVALVLSDGGRDRVVAGLVSAGFFFYFFNIYRLNNIFQCRDEKKKIVQ